MPGYENLTPDQIIYLMHLAVLACFLILLSRVVPAILEYRSMRFLEVKIKQCDGSNASTLLGKFMSWLREKRKEKRPYHSYSK